MSDPKTRHAPTPPLPSIAVEREKAVPPTRLRTHFFMDIPLGLFNGRFARELRDNGRIMGIVCRHCGFSMLPPQAICTVCHGENLEDPNWVEMGPEATLASFMTFNMPFIGVNDLSVQKGHHTVGQLMIDSPGRTAGFLFHYIAESDPAKMRDGMRVRAVFRPREERQGVMTDILHWVPVEPA